LTPERERTPIIIPPRNVELLPSGAADAVTTAALAAAAASAIGSSASVLYASRAAQMLQLGRCRGPTYSRGSLSFAESPLPVPLGTSDLAGHLGGAVVPSLIVFGFTAIHYVIGVVLARALALRTVEEGLAMVRHPHLTAPLALWLLPGAVSNAMTVAIHAPPAVRVLGGATLAAWLLWVVYVAFIVFSEELPRRCVWIRSDNAAPWLERVLVQGRWHAKPQTYFLQRYGYFFAEYRPGRQIMLAVDLLLFIVSSALAGTRLDDSTACDAVAYAFISVVMLHFVIVVWSSPYAAAISMGLMLVASFAFVIVAVFLSMTVSGGVDWAPEAAGWTLVATVGVLSIKSVFDFVAFAASCVWRPPVLVERHQSPSPVKAEARSDSALESPLLPRDAGYPASPLLRSRGHSPSGLPLQEGAALEIPRLMHWADAPTPLLTGTRWGTSQRSPQFGSMGAEEVQLHDGLVDWQHEEERLAALLNGFGPVARFANPLQHMEGEDRGEDAGSHHHYL
jgi:hypothetical protein